MPSYAALGEIMIEMAQQPRQVPTSQPDQARDYRLGFAGDTYNTAVYMARLGLAVSYITRLGDDGYSEQMLQQMRQEGIDTRAVAQVAGRSPGLYLIENRPDGERSFAYWRGQSPARELFDRDEDLALLEGFDGLYLSGISLAILAEPARERLFNALAALRQRGVQVAFDSNFRPRLWPDRPQAQAVMERMLSLSDIALLSLEDEGLLWGDARLEACFRRHEGRGLGELVIKQGPEALWLCWAGQRESFQVPPVAQVLDTTGAGDSFNGAYLAARWQGLPPKLAAAQGCACAAQVIQHRGAIVPRDTQDLSLIRGAQG